MFADKSRKRRVSDISITEPSSKAPSCSKKIQLFLLVEALENSLFSSSMETMNHSRLR